MGLLSNLNRLRTALTDIFVGLPTARVEPLIVDFISETTFSSPGAREETLGCVWSVAAPSANDVVIVPSRSVHPDSKSPVVCIVALREKLDTTSFRDNPIISEFLARHVTARIFLHLPNSQDPPVELVASTMVRSRVSDGGLCSVVICVELPSINEGGALSYFAGATLHINSIRIAGAAVDMPSPGTTWTIPIAMARGMNTPLLLPGTATNYPGTPCITQEGRSEYILLGSTCRDCRQARAHYRRAQSYFACVLTLNTRGLFVVQ
jgi:hypothetical protein